MAIYVCVGCVLQELILGKVVDVEVQGWDK
jgi:hypothetical protein